MQERIEASEREKYLKRHQHEQEMRLAQEMEKLKWEEQRDKRYRQQIKENRYDHSRSFSIAKRQFNVRTPIPNREELYLLK